MKKSHIIIRWVPEVFQFLLLICLAATQLAGCVKLTTTYSTFQVETSDLDKVKVIVHFSFIESGFDGGSMRVNRKEEIVYSMSGKPNLFYVTYKKVHDRLTIQIKNTTAGASGAELSQIREDLAKIAGHITQKLEEGNIKATVETKSFWIPDPNML